MTANMLAAAHVRNLTDPTRSFRTSVYQVSCPNWYLGVQAPFPPLHEPQNLQWAPPKLRFSPEQDPNPPFRTDYPPATGEKVIRSRPGHVSNPRAPTTTTLGVWLQQHHV